MGNAARFVILIVGVASVASCTLLTSFEGLTGDDASDAPGKARRFAIGHAAAGRKRRAHTGLVRPVAGHLVQGWLGLDWRPVLSRFAC